MRARARTREQIAESTAVFSVRARACVRACVPTYLNTACSCSFAGSCCCRSGADFEKEAGGPLFFIYTLLSVGSVVGAIYLITHSDDLVMPETVEDSSVVSRPDQKAETRAESRDQSREQRAGHSTDRGLPTDGERKPAERFSNTLTDAAAAWRGVAGCA